MIDELEVIDLISVNLAFWIIFFFPLFSIIDRRKKSLEEVKQFVQGRYYGIRFFITIYLLLMFGLLVYLTLPTMRENILANILTIALVGIVILRIITFSSKDYRN